MSLNHLVTKIHDCLDSKFIQSHGAKRLALVELDEQPTTTCKEVVINARGLMPLVIQLDLTSNQDPSQTDIHPLLTKHKGLKVKCDYIVICPYRNKIYFLIIDLKSGQPGGWEKQCMAGEALIRYVVSTIERVYKLNINKHAVYRYLLFSTNEDAFQASRFKKNTSDRAFEYNENIINSDITIKFIEKTCNRTYDDLRMFLI